MLPCRKGQSDTVKASANRPSRSKVSAAHAPLYNICPIVCTRGERALLRLPGILAERSHGCHDRRKPEEAVDAAAVTTALLLALPVGLRERTRKQGPHN